MKGATMKTKLVLATCLPLLIGSAALLYNDYREQKHQALEDAKSYLLLLAEKEACKLDKQFCDVEDQAKRQALEISKNRYTQPAKIDSILKDSMIVDPNICITFMAFEPKIKGLTENGKLFGPILVRRDDGSIFRKEVQNNYNYLTHDWYLIPKLLGENVWSEPFLSSVYEGHQRIICTYSVPFYYGSKFAGVTGADVQLTELSERLSKQHTIGNGYIALLSNDGTFMAHPNKNLIMNWSIFALAEWYDRPDLADLGHRMTAGESGIVRMKDFDSDKIKWLVFTPVKSTGWSLMMTFSEDYIISEVTKALNRRIFFFAIGLFVILCITACISIKIANRLRRMADAADHIARGDLKAAAASLDVIKEKQHCSAKDRDETKRLIASMDSMANHLDALVTHVQNSADGINESSQTIATHVGDLEVSSTEQATSTNQIVASAKEIAATAQDLVSTMQEVLFATEETENIASQGHDDLEQMYGAMTNLQRQTKVIAEKLETIHDKAENITCIITTIVQVADRTNLLSLNAAIEAEQAGEHGKGFAVVAREIRRLADQTAAATLHIERTVKEMLTAVITGVQEMSQFNQQVEGDVEVIGRVGKQMDQIIEDVQNLAPKFNTVQKGMGAQAVAASQISEAMIQVGNGAQQNVKAINELNQIAQALHFSAEALSDEVSSFKSKNS